MKRGFKAGYVACLPVALSASVYGSVLGVLAAQNGMSLLMLLLTDFVIFAGSAQFVVAEMWQPPLPVAAMVVAVAMINLRYALMCGSLRDLYEGKSWWTRLLHMYYVTDESWAVSIGAHRQGEATPNFVLGGGICMQSLWVVGTILGHRLGAIISNPEAFALDFAFTAVFTALTVGLWRGKHDLLPWIVSALLAIVSAWLLPGRWYIVIGGIGGALIPAFFGKDEE